MASEPVATDDRPCPWCPEPLLRQHAAAVLMLVEGVVDFRWAHKQCATFAAKKANPDRVMYPKHSACLRCGGTMADGSHTLAAQDAFCDHDCTLPWVHPTRPDHADRRAALVAGG